MTVTCAQGEKSQLVPEDIGKQAAYMLLEEVQRGGICDSMHQVTHSPHFEGTVMQACCIRSSCGK